MKQKGRGMLKFDVVVVGGGHAGIEAAAAAAKMGCSVAMVTMDKYAMGRLSCNPAIGGSAKGHLVHEIDALGGVMGVIADRSGIQFRTLNKSKGPAVWAGRSQADRELYSKEALKIVESIDGIQIIEDSVTGVMVRGKRITGAVCKSGRKLNCKSLIICSGTFMNGLMHTGLESVKGGRFGESPSTGLTEELERLGFVSGRLKTGTPPRLIKETIDFSVLEEQPGDNDPEPFSRFTNREEFPFLPQVSCHIAHTDDSVHKILQTGFDESPMFTGLINGVGPRYCPSIEDKIVRFSDKKSHQLFLEPEGLDDNLIYLNGFSTSLPADVQLKAIRNIRGLENAEMARPGYAVEYDYFPPYQVELTLETKLIEGLYFAGQINGTSGYEEAAGQGLVAGINAALKIHNKKEFVLKRSEAYIGVLIDDLVGKSTNEPYRMFTSRAEHRLLLRQDNADRRLLKYGYEFGLIPEKTYQELIERENLISSGIKALRKLRLKPEKVNKLLLEKGTTEIDSPETIDKLIKRPNMDLTLLLNLLESDQTSEIKAALSDKTALRQIEIELKYEGYINRQQEMISKMEKLESVTIPHHFEFGNIHAISTEGREKLTKIKPRSIGQAARISGVTPSDISILLVYLRN